MRYFLAGEECSRREKSQAIAGPGHSLAVTSNGAVYSFGSNSSGQLGHGTTDEESRPRLIRSSTHSNLSRLVRSLAKEEEIRRLMALVLMQISARNPHYSCCSWSWKNNADK